MRVKSKEITDFIMNFYRLIENNRRTMVFNRSPF